MNLSNIVDISQIIGVIAVVLSLIFIGIQIKQNTNATKAAVRQSVASNDITYLNTSLNSDIIANANAKIADGKDITTAEREQLIWQQFVNFMIFETVYYHFNEGYVEKELWERYKTIITGLLSNNIYAQNAWIRYKNVYTNSFYKEIQRILAKSNIKIDATKFESVKSDVNAGKKSQDENVE